MSILSWEYEVCKWSPLRTFFFEYDNISNGNLIDLKRLFLNVSLKKPLLSLWTLDLIINFNEIDKLINFLISSYGLPNILYQRLQKNKKNYFIKNEKNLQTIKNYNQHDIEIFDLLNKQNLD